MAEKTAQTGFADFDWNSVGKKQDNYSAEEKQPWMNCGQKLSTITDLQILEGVVVSKNNREVVVNIGYKSDGVVPLSEFRYNPDLKVGNKIEVLLDKAEVLRSIRFFFIKTTQKAWDRVNEALTNDEVIKEVLCKCSRPKN